MIPDSEYLSLVDGTRRPPTVLKQILKPWVARLNSVVDRGADMILQWTMQDLAEDWESCDDWVERTIPHHEDHAFLCPEHYASKSRAAHRRWVVSHLLTLCLETAKMDTRYWGIVDPTVQSWCSYCKQPRPIDEFQSSRYTCEDCFLRRKG